MGNPEHLPWELEDPSDVWFIPATYELPDPAPPALSLEAHAALQGPFRFQQPLLCLSLPLLSPCISFIFILFSLFFFFSCL